MTRPVALVLLAVLAAPCGAAAQTEGRFHTGALTWTPTLALRDAGLDTNVYDEATNARRDNLAVFSPQVQGLLRVSAVDVTFATEAEFVYFQRYTAERSINTRANVRLDLRGSRVNPYVSAGVVNWRERINSEIDLRARRNDRDGAAGVMVHLTPRVAIDLSGRFTSSRFDEGEVFRGVGLAERLNRESLGATLGVKYEVTPLTRVVIEGAASQDRFTLSPDYDADNLRVQGGVEFEPDAVLKGRAMVGFHQIAARGSRAFGFEGVTAAVDLGYVLLGRTRFDVRVARDTSYSFEAQPYFLQVQYGGEILHNLFGPVDVIGRVSRETLDYPGIPERELPAYALEVRRYGGALAIRPGERVRLTLNYEATERDSEQLAGRGFDRRRVYTTVTYGF